MTISCVVAIAVLERCFEQEGWPKKNDLKGIALQVELKGFKNHFLHFNFVLNHAKQGFKF